MAQVFSFQGAIIQVCCLRKKRPTQDRSKKGTKPGHLANLLSEGRGLLSSGIGVRGKGGGAWKLSLDLFWGRGQTPARTTCVCVDIISKYCDAKFGGKFIVGRGVETILLDKICWELAQGLILRGTTSRNAIAWGYREAVDRFPENAFPFTCRERDMESDFIIDMQDKMTSIVNKKVS